MKAILLLSFFLTLTATAFTQVNKGQFLIGGNLTFESTKSEYSGNTYEASDFFIAPNVGYFVIDKMSVGLRVDFRAYNSSSSNAVIHQVNTYVLPTLRYYFLPADKKVNAFIDGSYIYGKNKFRSESNPESYITKTTGYYFFGGPSIFLTRQIALEFTLGYRHTKTSDFGDHKESKFSSGFALQVHLGKMKKKSKA